MKNGTIAFVAAPPSARSHADFGDGSAHPLRPLPTRGREGRGAQKPYRRRTLSALSRAFASVLILLACAVPAKAQDANQSTLGFVPDDRMVGHVAPTGSYAAIDAERLKQSVREQVEISRRYRDGGRQFWGRIIGTEGDAESAAWMADRLREAGASVRLESLSLPPQWIPDSWEVTLESGEAPAVLASAWPAYTSPGTSPAGVELEAVYLGWGTEADMVGRDVRGKAAFIYSMPTSSAIRHSATLNGSLLRAQERGAAAIFVVIELPGNVSSSLFPAGTSVPTFALGSADGAAVRRSIETAPPGRPPLVRVRLDVGMVAGLTTTNVWGEVAGTGGTGEDVVVVAHRDAFFYGASDNASGVATAIELAHYYAGLPPARRPRTLRILGTPGHHDVGSIGQEWLFEERERVLGRTALLINAEHTAYTLIERWGPDLVPANVQGPFSWTVNGSARLSAIADAAFDEFAIPRWATPGGPTGEFARVRGLVPSVGLMHAATLLHTDAETAESVPASGLAAVTRAYARIIDEINLLEIAELAP